MRAETFGAILARELRALRREVEAYPDDESPWALPPGAPNATGTLVLHLAGNLRHFVGAQLGATGYLRDRDAEFATRALTRAELCAQIDDAVLAVERTLGALDDDALDAPYPIAAGAWRGPTGEWLAHLVAHTAYHLGQVDYHRRLVTGDGRSAGALALGELPSARAAREE
jgi:hypothetical protein